VLHLSLTKLILALSRYNIGIRNDNDTIPNIEGYSEQALSLYACHHVVRSVKKKKKQLEDYPLQPGPGDILPFIHRF